MAGFFFWKSPKLFSVATHYQANILDISIQCLRTVISGIDWHGWGLLGGGGGTPPHKKTALMGVGSGVGKLDKFRIKKNGFLKAGRKPPQPTSSLSQTHYWSKISSLKPCRVKFSAFDTLHTPWNFIPHKYAWNTDVQLPQKSHEGGELDLDNLSKFMFKLGIFIHFGLKTYLVLIKSAEPIKNSR